MTESHAHAPRRAAFAFVFVTVLLDMFAIGIIIPVLPKLVEDFMGGNTARAAIVYGVFGTAWALMQFLFSPILGALSDRFGRRPETAGGGLASTACSNQRLSAAVGTRLFHTA